MKFSTQILPLLNWCCLWLKVLVWVQFKTAMGECTFLFSIQALFTAFLLINNIFMFPFPVKPINQVHYLRKLGRDSPILILVIDWAFTMKTYARRETMIGKSQPWMQRRTFHQSIHGVYKAVFTPSFDGLLYKLCHMARGRRGVGKLSLCLDYYYYYFFNVGPPKEDIFFWPPSIVYISINGHIYFTDYISIVGLWGQLSCTASTTLSFLTCCGHSFLL